MKRRNPRRLYAKSVIRQLIFPAMLGMIATLLVVAALIGIGFLLSWLFGGF